jgi:RNA polymerase sigma factor (TIGR02999 family)
MKTVTQILQAIRQGDPSASDELLPLVYDELRQLARQKMASQKAGQTLDATALVHEAYLRLVSQDTEPHWESRRHFFAAAAQAMRHILIDQARRKRRGKHGGDWVRQQLEANQFTAPEVREDLLALNEALDKLSQDQPDVAELVKLRYFAGFTIKQAAELLDISPRTADTWWAYARAWLLAELKDRSE